MRKMERVPKVLKEGLREIEERLRMLSERYLRGEIGFEEYLEERVRLELLREEKVEENLGRLFRGYSPKRGTRPK